MSKSIKFDDSVYMDASGISVNSDGETLTDTFAKNVGNLIVPNTTYVDAPSIEAIRFGSLMFVTISFTAKSQIPNGTQLFSVTGTHKVKSLKYIHMYNADNAGFAGIGVLVSDSPSGISVSSATLPQANTRYYIEDWFVIEKA